MPTSVPTAVQRAIEHDTTRAIARLLPYRHVAVLGLSYKPDTAITDNSYGLAVAYGLHVAGTMKPPEPSASMVLGTAVHSMLLEPDKDSIAVAPAINRRTNAGKEKWEEFSIDAETKGKTVCLPLNGNSGHSGKRSRAVRSWPLSGGPRPKTREEILGCRIF